MTEATARQEVLEAGRALLEAGLVARTWGNVSCRLGRDSFVITPSGLGYERMTAGDLVECALDGGGCRGWREPSSERGVHAAVYRRFPEAGFVIHTHQTYGTALGLAGFGDWQLSAEERAALGGIGRAEYGLPGTEELWALVDAVLAKGARTVLMAHHGVLIAGESREEAFARAALVETLAQSACLGQPQPGLMAENNIAALAAAVNIPGWLVSFSVEPAVVGASCLDQPILAQLDDMAQIIGPCLVIAEPDPAAIQAGLAEAAAVLVQGQGAVFRARTPGDLNAIRLILGKSCVCKLHTEAWGTDPILSPKDAAHMRLIYEQKYSKKMEG